MNKFWRSVLSAINEKRNILVFSMASYALGVYVALKESERAKYRLLINKIETEAKISQINTELMLTLNETLSEELDERAAEIERLKKELACVAGGN